MNRSTRTFRWMLCWLCLSIAGCTDVTPELDSNRADSQDPMPPSLRAAWIQKVQHSAGPDYAIGNARDRRFRFEARHPRQNLRTRFSADRVELSDRDGRAPLRIALARINGLEPGAGRVEREANRVTVARPGIDEWYVHGPMGLEQGFTIPEELPSAGDRTGVLRLELSIEGDYAPTKRGDMIAWRSPTRTIETRELYAFDANGTQLRASMHASRSKFTIDIDVEKAAYPIVVDPLWVEQQKLVASNAIGTGWFGYSVSVSGNTAVIGMPHDGSKGLRAGSAHVFVWNGTNWASQQALEPSGLAEGDEFGISVSVSGDTAVVGAFQDDDNGSGSGSAHVFVRSGAVWTEQQKLTPSGGSAGDQFGVTVSLDGDTVVVGAPYDDQRGGDAGAAHVFVRSGVIWSEQQKLVGWNSDGEDNFGWAVSVDEDTAVVGTPNDEDLGVGSGSAFVFLRSGSTWSAQQKLLASDGSDDDRFGHALVIEGDNVVVGAPFNDDDGTDSGSAYVFVRSGTTWSQQRKLLGSDSAAGDQFGFSVDVSGESTVIGAHRDDATALNVGSAYVFVRSGTAWSQQQKLLSSNIAGFHFGTSVSISGDAIIGGAPKQYVPGIAYAYRRSGTVWSADEKIGPSVAGPTDQDFGYAVSIDGDTAVVGAPRYDGWGTPDEGAAYVFVRTGTAWTEQQELRASDRANGDDFGGSVSVSGDTIVVGAFDDDDLGLSSGAAYVFVRSGTVWTEQQKLLASDGSANDRFGTAVSVHGDTALVGAYLDDDAGIDSGSAYVFVRSGSTWTEEQKLLAPDGAAGDYFAFSVSVQADTAAVGAFTDDDAGIDSGSAYVFTRSGAVWSVQRKLVPADGAERDGFGYVVSLSGDTLAVGAPSDGSLAPDAGSVYVFTRSAGVWTQEQELFASDASASQQFGAAVSIDADTMLVGVPLDSDNGISAGAAYVLVRNGAAWSEVGKILAPDAEERDSFGWSVALFGETALIGAYEEDERGTGAGAAYAFILMLENGDPCSMDGQCLSDLCDPVDLICACVDASDCGVDEVCDTNEAPNACEKSGLCGNGLVEAGETCDDGRLVSGDGCSATCFIDNQGNGSDCSNGGGAACASGICDATETPDTCEPASSCGNSVLEAGEACDDGNVTSGDGCSATCFVDNLPNGSDCTTNGAAACASGVCDVTETPDTCEAAGSCGNGAVETGETCDDGGVGSGDGCSATCFIDNLPNGSDCTANGAAACASGLCDTTETPDACEAADTCGNGVVEGGEACDDGNVTGGDGCSATCFVDGLPNGSDCTSGGSSACASGVCDTTETPASCEPANSCGNGAVEAGESCDDGNIVSGDGCSATCFIDNLPNGTDCSANGANVCASGVCDATETPAACEAADTCGNGLVEVGEICDDGNSVSGDGCSAACFIDGLPNGTDCTGGGNAACASGVCDTTETPNTCEPSGSCGNSVLEAGETCDDGNVTNSDGCSATCFVDNLPNGSDCTSGGNAACVSGVCDASEAPDACEPANVCGNGLGEAGEACDDGNVTSGDGCSATCFIDGLPNGSDCTNGGDAACVSGLCDTTETRDRCEAPDSCGNGVLEAGEACDDGNVTSGDGCSATCFPDNLPIGVDCSLNGAAACASGVCDMTSVPARCEPAGACGNGLLEFPEACDDGNTFGGDGCSMLCFPDSLPPGSNCNNGGDAACLSGVCDTSETPDTCEAPDVCGNGRVDAGEACDDGNLRSGDGCSGTCFADDLPNESDCSQNGAVSCASGVCDTTETPASCEASGVCGNGLLERGEACDDGGVLPGDGCSAACFVEEQDNGSDCTVGGNEACASGVCDESETPATCEAADVCGNGVIEGSEVCDDGNAEAGDGCDPQCLLEVDMGPCTEGTQCGTGVCNTLARSAVCARALSCGNGLFEAGEACDDGNLTGGDGCSESCALENGWRGGAGCSVGANGESDGPVWLFGLLALAARRPRRRLQPR